MDMFRWQKLVHGTKIGTRALYKRFKKEMTKILLVLAIFILTDETSARSCAPLFSLHTSNSSTAPKAVLSAQLSGEFVGYVKALNDGPGLNTRPLYIHVNKRSGNKIEVTYGDIMFGGYKTRPLSLRDQIVDEKGTTVSTYSYVRNGTELLTLKTYDNTRGGKKVSFFQLNVKSEVSTPSSRERVYQFNTQDS